MSEETKTIVEAHKENLELLRCAFLENRVALMECIDTKTGEHVAVLCAMNETEGEFEFVPFASFFNENPYDRLIPATDKAFDEASRDGT